MRPSLFACLVLLLLPLTARCQNGTGIYMEPGLVLRAASPRQLTLNANVLQFLYQPGGDSIAYVGVRDDNGARTFSVKFVGAHQKDPDTRTLYTVTGDSPDAHAASPGVPTLILLGWSGNGRYLMFEQVSDNGLSEPCLCVDAGSLSFLTRTIPMPTGTGLTLSAWSPSYGRFLITVRDVRSDGSLSPVSAAELYDPTRDQVQPLTIPADQNVRGWMDEGHLLLRQTATTPGEKPTYFSYSVATGTETESAETRPVAHGDVAMGTFADATIPKLPGLSLETQPHTLKDAQGVAETKAETVWIRRAKSPKAMSALAVSVTPGADDPQAQWSPEGDGVAFLAHGDLFVAAMTKQEATPREKVAAGEKLGCDEEKQIILANLKELGLGILQYTQDNDEKFPAGEGFHDAVFPYIKDDSVFNFPGVPITYHMPPGKTLASVESPMDAVLATADTPCAHIVLYVDGHVKAFDKADATGP